MMALFAVMAYPRRAPCYMNYASIIYALPSNYGWEAEKEQRWSGKLLSSPIIRNHTRYEGFFNRVGRQLWFGDNSLLRCSLCLVPGDKVTFHIEVDRLEKYQALC